MRFFNDKRLEYSNTQTLESFSFTCPWCESIISPTKGYQTANPVKKLYICPNCNEVILTSFWDTFPQSKYGKTVKKLPSLVHNVYEECRKCYSVDAYNSVVMLGRKLLMHIAVNEGAEKGKKFIEYVDFLKEEGYIPPKSKHLLDFMRKQGNEANHEIDSKDNETAKKVIDFLELILKFIYEYADEEAEKNGKE